MRLRVVELPNQFQSAHTRQPEVCQHDIARTSAGTAQAFITAARMCDGKALVLENLAQVCREIRVIFNQQNTGTAGHKLTLPSETLNG